MRIRFVVLAAGALLLAATFGATARDANAYPCTGNAYYVDVNTGSNSNSGCSGSPWQTLQFAMDSANAGDTVLVKPGTYSTVGSGLPVIDCDGSADSGTSSDPIVFYPDYTPPGSGDPWDTLDPPAPIELTSNADGVIRYGCDYVEIYGFKVIGPSTISSGANVVVEAGSESSAFIRGEVRDSLCQGVYTEEDPDGAGSAVASLDFQLSRSWIHHNGSSPDAQGNGGCRSSSNQSQQSHGVYLEGDEHDVNNNLIERNGHGFGLHIFDKGRASFVVQNTVLYNGGLRQCCGGAVIGGGAGSELDIIMFANNVIAHNYGKGLEMRSGVNNTTCAYVVYNTFYDNRGNHSRPPAQNADNWDGSGGSVPGDDWDELDCWEELGGGTNETADPGLTNDPWPKTSTQLWSAVYGGSFTVDASLDGTYKDNAYEGFSWSWAYGGGARCRGAGYDRGAYEYMEAPTGDCLN